MTTAGLATGQRRRRPQTVAESHRSWLELVDREGPFLAVPPLKRVWPDGIPNFKLENPKRYTAFRDAARTFEKVWERWDEDPDDESGLERYRQARDEWVRIVLEKVIGWGDRLDWGEVPGVVAHSPDRTVAATAQAALRGKDGLGALVRVVDPTDSLRSTPNDRWAATPIDRTEELLHHSEVGIGIVTDGRWWALVSAGDGRMAASGVVDALAWVEEPRTRDAFFTLLDRKYLIGGTADERLPVLFDESVAEAEEITEALGAQVRRAVELLVKSFGETAAEAIRRGRPDPLPEDTHAVYEAAVTVMMRTVFLLFAEERSLLPSGELFEQGYGITGELDRLTGRANAEGEEALDATSHTWHRLLATSHALFAGASFENLRMPAYGGSLFDPDRFPFLTATTDTGALALNAADRVLLHVLESVQVATVKGEARRISFRDVDVEQIGYIYEGLLGYTCVRVDEPYLGLLGKKGDAPEIPLVHLEQLSKTHPKPKELAKTIEVWLKDDQPGAKMATVASLAKAIDGEVDSTDVSALAQIVGDDAELLARVEPWLGIVRHDLRGAPLVVPAGGLLVEETPSRRNMGAHYTPKALAEEVVLHALEPVCYHPGPHQTASRDEWRLKTSDELLDLKVADIACGSGAFLVAAARFLAARVVEAWVAEDPTNAQRRDLYTRAVRQVVANCIYGADINDMAVEMCKLSLWLVSLDRDLPFSFVDDKVFLGNSLLGLTSLDQLRKLHIDPSRVPLDRKFDMFEVDIDAIMRKAVSLRERLATEIDESDPARTSAAKHRQLAEFHEVTASLGRIADGVIAAGLELGGKPGKDLDDAYENLRLAVKQAYPGTGSRPDGEWLDRVIDRGLTPTVETDYLHWQPLHWVLQAPDVIVDHGGFDAIIGNPPFLGGQKLTGAMGDGVRDWFVEVLANGVRGSADLVAYFLLRADALLTGTGTLGLIATNTIAQGDTREVGLDQLVQGGHFTITRAIQSRSWPARSANLEYAAVWGTLDDVADAVPRAADDIEVHRISTLLEAAGRVSGNPVRLAENLGVGFIGCYVLGKGFIIEPDEAQQWIAEDPRNAEVLFPFLNGEDLNGRPDCSPSRWVIDFNNRDLLEAKKFTLPIQRVLELVKPDRDRLDGRNPTGTDRAKHWWKFGRRSPAMRAAIAEMSEVLVIALVSKTVMPLRVQTGQIFSHALGVFALTDASGLVTLSSSLHQLWVVTYGSTLETRVRYTPSDVFETFPRPQPTKRMEKIGRILDEERREIMLRRELGLTKLYNRVNDPDVRDADDPDVARLREIHVEIDEAVMEAYGWSDVPLGHGFHTYRQMQRWTVSPAARVEILDRLLEENHRRAAIEVGDATLTKATKRKKNKTGTVEMFDE